MEYLITNNTKLANLLRTIRKEYGWSQAEAANKSGLLPKTISLIENNPGGCSIDTLSKYLSGLNLEMVFQNKITAAEIAADTEW